MTSIVIYLTYRLTSSDATIGVVFLFMLVNWWVEEHQRFFIQRFNFFFIFVTFFTFFNVFSGTFFTSLPWHGYNFGSKRSEVNVAVVEDGL